MNTARAPNTRIGFNTSQPQIRRFSFFGLTYLGECPGVSLILLTLHISLDSLCQNLLFENRQPCGILSQIATIAQSSTASEFDRMGCGLPRHHCCRPTMVISNSDWPSQIGDAFGNGTYRSRSGRT